MKLYNTDSNFALSARMISALAFVPIDDYFEDCYISRMQRRNGRRAPLFAPSIWSCYQRTLNSEARTNNHAEATHRRLQAEFGVDHPTLWKFIDGIRVVQKSIDQIYRQFVRGDQGSKKRNKYQQADARILTIVEDHENREFMEYLRGIAYNFIMD
jgi:hypothetical protein